MPSQPRRDPAALTSFLLFWILSSFQWMSTYTDGSSIKIVLYFFLDHLDDNLMIKVLNKKVCFFYSLKFKLCNYLYDGHWGLHGR
jgi:hypothetical protein